MKPTKKQKIFDLKMILWHIYLRNLILKPFIRDYEICSCSTFNFLKKAIIIANYQRKCLSVRS